MTSIANFKRDRINELVHTATNDKNSLEKWPDLQIPLLEGDEYWEDWYRYSYGFLLLVGIDMVDQMG